MEDSYFDMPTGYNDADLEMSALEARGNLSARLKSRGICDHGWTQGYTAECRPDLNPGEVQCLHCKEVFSSQSALDDAIGDVLGEYS